MFTITIITVGKPKKGPVEEIIAEMQKRLTPYARLEHKIIKEERFSSPSDAPQVHKKEGERIRAAMNKDAYSVLLTEHGETLSSEAFTKLMIVWSENEARTIEFIIAGPLGMDPALKEEVDATLSLSPMTFPHELAQAILMEQLYRAMTILKGKTYHY